MIVPAMTIEEVRHEMLYDFEAVNRKAHAHAQVVFQQMKRKGLSHEKQIIKYPSARKNEWVILYDIFPNNMHYIYYTEASDKRGRVAYQFLFDDKNHENGTIKYNTHFFKRYRERQNPKLNNPSELIRCFFKHNAECSFGQTQVLEDGRRLANYVFTEGIGMGWVNWETRITNLKTFLPFSMLNKTQESFADYILHYQDGDEFNMKIKTESLKHKLK